MSPRLWLHRLVTGATVAKNVAHVLLGDIPDAVGTAVLGPYEDKTTTVDEETVAFTTDAFHVPMLVRNVSVIQVRKRGVGSRVVHRTLVTGSLYACPLCGKHIHTIVLPKRPLSEVVARVTTAIVTARLTCRHFPHEQVFS